MIKLSLLVLLAASATACGGAPPAPAAPTPANPSQAIGDQAGACAHVLTTMLDRLMQTGDAPAPHVDHPAPALLATVIGPMTGACTADDWSPVTLHCYDTVKVDDDLRGCLATMTPAQRANLDGRAQAADAARGSGEP